MPTNRVYPAADGVATWYADKSSSVGTAGEVTIGTHVGALAPSGVGIPDDFTGYTPINRIDNPADGINDSADYVVYFQKDGTDPLEVYKATDADPSTLVQLTTGAEFDLVSPMVIPE